MVLFHLFLLLLWAFHEQCVSAQSIPTISSDIPSSITPTSLDSSLTPKTIAISQSRSDNSTRTTATEDVTAIVGQSTSVPRDPRSSSTTSARPKATNTTPCNGYTEFCQRKYSNISMVLAHNSPFVRAHNAASNQAYPVTDQLNDGIRGVSFETQKPNSTSTIRLCHTSCSLLDVGPLSDYLTTVRAWLDTHPYEVLTIFIGNNNGQSTRIPVTEYVAHFETAGLTQYLYTPPALAMNITDWPALGEMILKNQRVVVMMDYGTNQTAVPWILSEYNYLWETPFSPTNAAFPCTQNRPPNQAQALSDQRMYLMNHNLNINISLAGFDGILIPAYSLLDEVNAVSGNGSLGLNVQNCERMWGRPPSWLLVDYYNFGNFNGSVFQVAADANGVTYQRGECCGGSGSSKGGADRRGGSMDLTMGMLIGSLVVSFWW